MASLDVSSHSRFFDYLADLVDPKYYHAEEREHINTKYMKHDERAATKRAFKEQYKQNKRAKLDPDAVKTTTELQSKQAREQQQEHDIQEQSEAAAAAAAALGGSNQHHQQLGKLHLSAGSQPSREDLLKRLHAKMQEARARRKATDQDNTSAAAAAAAATSAGNGPSKTAVDAKQWRQQQLGKRLKSKHQQQQQQQGVLQLEAGQKRKLQEHDKPTIAAAAAQPPPQKVKNVAQQQQQQQHDQAGAGLSFSRLVVDAGRPGPGKRGAKKPTKEDALKAAEAKQQRLAEATARDDKDLIAAEAWRAALGRASGERVLDDPKLLRRSLKREEQDKARKGKRWEERVVAQQEQQQVRQDRRKNNLAARANAKQEKKKAKRDKKLLRAGFEGRKSGFINAAKPK